MISIEEACYAMLKHDGAKYIWSVYDFGNFYVISTEAERGDYWAMDVPVVKKSDGTVDGCQLYDYGMLRSKGKYKECIVPEKFRDPNYSYEDRN